MDANRENLRIALWVAIVALMAAVIPIWPYGLYTLLRLVVTGVSLYAIYVFGLGESKRTVGFVAVALLFNPVFPVHLSRLIWFPIDLGVAFWFWRVVESTSTGGPKRDEGAHAESSLDRERDK